MKTSANKEIADPLANTAFRPPGILENLREAVFGIQRPMDCLQMEVTSHCGGACTYCPHTSQKEFWKSRHMSAETFARAWPLLRVARRAHLQGWGEPLLHPRFFDFAALARKAGCQVSTTSCGLGMDEARAARIVESGLDIVAFSLAGTDEQGNSARKGISFSCVRKAIRTLRECIKKHGSGPEIHIAYIMLADRVKAVTRLPELMDELEVEAAVVSTLDYLATPGDIKLAFRPGETGKIMEAENILRSASARASEMGRSIHYALPGEKAVSYAGGCRENILHSLYIDADGEVSPCVYLNVPGADADEKRRTYGNINQEDPLLIWRKNNFREFRSSLKENRPDEACANCPKRFEVVGQNSANN